MRSVLVVQEESGECVGSEIGLADSWWTRFRGLLGHPPLEAEQGLLLLDCDSVHTVGMGQDIDVAFLDADGTVVRSLPSLRPWRIGVGGAGAVHTLELRAGRLAETGTVPGVRLSWS